MTFGSLFAGIGGFDLGLERAGMECKWQVEIDDFCNRVLEIHWPNVKRYRDVREVGAHNLEPVDLICGGFPCQPFSVAGKQRGKEDDRHLWPEMFRIVSELRPTWVVGENVPGLVRLGLDEVLSDLEGIEYSTQTFDIPACAVDAPHVRHRIWIVAYSERDGWGSRGAKRERQPRRVASVGASIADVAHAVRIGSAAGISGQVAGDEGYAGIADNGCGEGSGGNFWLPEPELGRVAHGIPKRVDRLRSLGNAVVPQIVEVIGRAIMEVGK